MLCQTRTLAQETFVVILLVELIVIVDGALRIYFIALSLATSPILQITVVWDPSVPKSIRVKDPFMVAGQHLVVS